MGGLAAAVVVAVFAARPTLAQAPDDARAEAERHFLQGLALVENEDWEAALLEFRVSLELFPTRSALFNSAQMLKALHRYVEAVDTLQEWLARYRDEALADELAATEEALREWEGFIGELEIRVDEPGAELRLDGTGIGRSPLPGPIRVDVGTHRVEATLEGRLPQQEQVTIVSRQRIGLDLSLAELAPPPEVPALPPVPPAPVAIGVETHDGLLLRLTVGGGFVYNEEYVGEEFGGGGGAALAAGYSPVENFSLYLEFTGNHPQAFGLGIGIGGYFGPNLFLDGVFGYSYDAGMYGAVVFGKEWWIADQWGLGVALRQTVSTWSLEFPTLAASTFVCFTATVS
ncbi:MAG: hypothetical protein JXB32_02935 [Deltaproteobacteria bacterium]|nr:hypothetical protein [Deltaproteobacteria bacterium]